MSHQQWKTEYVHVCTAVNINAIVCDIFYPLVETIIFQLQRNRSHTAEETHLNIIWLPAGNQTWQWKSPMNGGFNRNIIDKMSIFQPAMFDETGE